MHPQNLCVHMHLHVHATHTHTHTHTHSVPAREESIAAMANACSYFPPNAEFIGAEGKKELMNVCSAKDLSEEARLYAKCVLMQVDNKGECMRMRVRVCAHTLRLMPTAAAATGASMSAVEVHIFCVY